MSNITSRDRGRLYNSHTEGWLGVYVEELFKPMRIALDVDYGVLVTGVVENSPAEEGGIKEGEVILEINNEKIKDYEDLKSVIEDNPGKEVEIKIKTRGKIKTLKIKLGEIEEKKHKWEFWCPRGKKEIRIYSP